MFHVKKILMVEILLFVQFLFIQSEFIVKASAGSGKAKTFVHNDEILRQQNEISDKAEEKLKSEDDQKLYYLPMQTVFDETTTLAGTRGLSTTSPPHLSINPAPIQTEYQGSTTLHEDSYVEGIYNNDPYQSQCVSETPFIELESRFLLPSKDPVQESVVMSGHLEVASKTSSFDEVTKISNMISKPSIVLQGTILHSHSLSDL